MEKNISPAKGIDRGLGGQLELASKVAKGQVVITVIAKDELPSYLQTASVGNLVNVKKVAEEGGDFPYLHPLKDRKYPSRKVSNVKVPKDYVAISFERRP